MKILINYIKGVKTRLQKHKKIKERLAYCSAFDAEKCVKDLGLVDLVKEAKK